MNIYDFDKTIYADDSSIDFFLFCMKRNLLTIFFLPQFIFSFFLYILKFINKTQLKESFFFFLRFVKDIDSTVSSFWETKESKIHIWYLNQRKSTDIIISASPDFLLRPIVEKLQATLIASIVNKKTGKFETKNCYGTEKLCRLRNSGVEKIEEFYSDSVSDLPLAQIAEKAFLVKKNTLWEWKR